jgi:hypothetical protein
MGQGELVAKVDDIQATCTSGTTTSCVTDSVFTVNQQEGWVLVVEDNADVAGGEPEGEMAQIIGGNTTNDLYLNTELPLTVALASSDLIRVHSVWVGDDSTSGDLAINCLGIVAASGGLTDQYYGWLQIYGMCPDALHNAVDVANGALLATATAAVTDSAALTGEVIVGYQIGVHTQSSHDTNKSPIFVQLFGHIGSDQQMYTIG